MDCSCATACAEKQQSQWVNNVTIWKFFMSGILGEFSVKRCALRFMMMPAFRRTTALSFIRIISWYFSSGSTRTIVIMPIIPALQFFGKP